MYWLYVVSAWLALALPARADDALARALFEQGLAAAAAQRWAEAASKFDASLAQRDMPATRFNLMLASYELSRHIEVVRHALAFLESHSHQTRDEPRAEAQRLLEEAISKLVIVEIGDLPADAKLRVDGREPSLIHAQRAFMEPGTHTLALEIDGQPREQASVAAQAGQSLSWPRIMRARLPAHEDLGNAAVLAVKVPDGGRPHEGRPRRDEPQRSPTRLREHVAWGLGIAGAAAALGAVACYGAAQRHANQLAEGGPERLGYPSAADRYDSIRRSVLPLALPGSVLMATAIALGAQVPRVDSLSLSGTSLALGAGLFGVGLAFMLLEPRPLIADTALDRPTREAASLLTTAGLPLLSYGMVALLRRDKHRAVKTGISSLRIVW